MCVLLIYELTGLIFPIHGVMNGSILWAVRIELCVCFMLFLHVL